MFGNAGSVPDSLTLSENIRSGLAAKTWKHLREIGYTAPELALVVGVSEKTIARKQSSREKMDVVEGDRTVRLATVTSEAAKAFGDLGKALRWLRKPNRVLSGNKPLDLLATEPGTALVRKALGLVEYGGVA
jgi:putative toxin-antitoxin system antitoxin component (TIGR02293 family)